MRTHSTEREETVARRTGNRRAYHASEDAARERFVLRLADHRRRRSRTRTLLFAPRCKAVSYILVDEFQDTNIAQLRLLELLANTKGIS